MITATETKVIKCPSCTRAAVFEDGDVLSRGLYVGFDSIGHTDIIALECPAHPFTTVFHDTPTGVEVCRHRPKCYRVGAPEHWPGMSESV